jgi:hypothetical protein
VKLIDQVAVGASGPPLREDHIAALLFGSALG